MRTHEERGVALRTHEKSGMASAHTTPIAHALSIYLILGLNLGESNTLLGRPGDRETADAPSL